MRPGTLVSSEDPKYVTPDLLVERVDEEYVVMLNDRNVPRLRISSAYEGVIAANKRKPDASEEQKQTRDYIQGKLASAKWLIQTIEQRRRTMIKVMNCIVREQREFFDKGIAFLRPLTLAQVARQIDMHESTVSRITTNKYIDTPQGIFELKFFFHSGIKSYMGNSLSSIRVKNMIKEVIAQEDPQRPLTDDEMVVVLMRKNAKIARRTITKYRKELNLPPASKRKKIF